MRQCVAIFVLMIHIISSDSCHILENTVIYGNTIQEHFGTSMVDCCALCYETYFCSAFSWKNIKNGTCWLKSEIPISNKNHVFTGIMQESSIKGLRSTPKPPQACQIEKDKNIPENDFGQYRNFSLTDCCDICERSVKCIAFAWSNMDSGTCWLKSKISKIKARTGFYIGFVNASKTEVTGTTDSCPPYAKKIDGDQCVAYVPLRKTWYDAQEFCQRFGAGSLAAFRNKAEFFKFNRWQKRNRNQTWLAGKQEKNGRYRWVGVQESLPWNSRFVVKSQIRPRRCVFSHRRALRATWCNAKKHFVCQFVEKISVPCLTGEWTEWSSCNGSSQSRTRNVLHHAWVPTEQNPEKAELCPAMEHRHCDAKKCDQNREVLKYGRCISHCPSYAVPIGDRCMIYSNVVQPFAAAELFCTGIGGHLAMFRSIQEQNLFLLRLRSDILPNRPGLVLLGHVYLGGRISENSSMLEWTNGLENNYTNWAPNRKQKPGCLTMAINNGNWWIDSQCKNRAFLCEFPIGSFQEFINEKHCGVADLDPVKNPREDWPKVAGIDVPLAKKEGPDFDEAVRRKRLANGFESNNTFWPWYVDLVGCGAALIHPQLVITAAHCGTNYRRVMLGWLNRFAGTDSRFADIPGETVYPGSINDIRRGGFGGCRGDMEVIKLLEPAPYTEMIRPVCLPEYGAESPIFDDFFCFATGRGSAKDKTFVGQLQMRPKHPKYINGAIQADHVYKTGAVCLGDSGSSLNCRRKSEDRWFAYGPACGITGCEGEDQAFFASTISWRPWLDKITFDLLYADNSGLLASNS